MPLTTLANKLLNDIEFNISTSTAYLDWLRKYTTYNGNKVSTMQEQVMWFYILAAYNAGGSARTIKSGFPYAREIFRRIGWGVPE